MTVGTQYHTAAIRELNDAARKSLTGILVVITQGIKELGDVYRIIGMVQHFTDFDEDNVEHDFGAFHLGVLIYWKIDYYDATMGFGSPDASDPAITNRVLTIMLASEY